MLDGGLQRGLGGLGGSEASSGVGESGEAKPSRDGIRDVRGAIRGEGLRSAGEKWGHHNPVSAIPEMWPCRSKCGLFENRRKLLIMMLVAKDDNASIAICKRVVRRHMVPRLLVRRVMNCTPGTFSNPKCFLVVLLFTAIRGAGLADCVPYRYCTVVRQTALGGLLRKGQLLVNARVH